MFSRGSNGCIQVKDYLNWLNKIKNIYIKVHTSTKLKRCHTTFCIIISSAEVFQTLPLHFDGWTWQVPADLFYYVLIHKTIKLIESFCMTVEVCLSIYLYQTWRSGLSWNRMCGPASHLAGVPSCFISSKDVEFSVNISTAEARQVWWDVSSHLSPLPAKTKTLKNACKR